MELRPFLKQSRYVTAVTGALFMCSRDLWRQLNGFNQEDFAIAFNDVDFCLRAKALGFESVVQPKAKAIHAESVSRGYETTVNKMLRFKAEQQRFLELHNDVLEKGDQYFSV